jgi:hypothetical protein
MKFLITTLFVLASIQAQAKPNPEIKVLEGKWKPSNDGVCFGKYESRHHLSKMNISVSDDSSELRLETDKAFNELIEYSDIGKGVQGGTDIAGNYTSPFGAILSTRKSKIEFKDDKLIYSFSYSIIGGWKSKPIFEVIDENHINYYEYNAKCELTRAE